MNTPVTKASWTLAPLILLAGATASAQSTGEGKGRQMEDLGRGVVAVRKPDNTVFVGWRHLGTDPDRIAFHLERTIGDGPPTRLNAAPISGATCSIDATADPSRSVAYSVRPIIDGKEGAASVACRLPANAPARPYLSIPLRTLPGHTPNDASVGDLDGDGEYEIVLKQEMRPRDNSQPGATGETKLEAYRLDGSFLWRINLGKNIREGAHYTPFLVYDLDGDGRAEVVCKTADGTIDGAGVAIGDPRADHRNEAGYVLEGPEFLTVFDGMTGKALASADYLPPRGDVAAWGDAYGNRVDRFLACVAYLDGARPSVVMCRGYYTRTVLVAWNWRGGKLERVWTFDSDAAPQGRAYRGQGNHNLSVGDIDSDGKDEIVYGACCIDDDGRGLYSTGLGHGDALHLSDIDPDRPGLEVFDIHEKPRHRVGAEFRDARTGALIWGKPSPDVGRGVAMDIDPRHRGYEMWASGEGLRGLWNVAGATVSEHKPRPCNFGIWWDGDPLREILDGTRITKWDWIGETEKNLLTVPPDECRSNNGTKSTPCLCADILGDWREEVLWRSADGKELRIYTTTIPTDRRLPTLMHDPQYRLSVAWQNVGYNQPTQTSFYLGEGMAAPPKAGDHGRPTRRVACGRAGPTRRGSSSQSFFAPAFLAAAPGPAIGGALRISSNVTKPSLSASSWANRSGGPRNSSREILPSPSVSMARRRSSITFGPSAASSLLREPSLSASRRSKKAGGPVNSARLTLPSPSLSIAKIRAPGRAPAAAAAPAPAFGLAADAARAFTSDASSEPSLFVSTLANIAGRPGNSALLTLPSPSLSIALNRTIGSPEKTPRLAAPPAPGPAPPRIDWTRSRNSAAWSFPSLSESPSLRSRSKAGRPFSGTSFGSITLSPLTSSRSNVSRGGVWRAWALAREVPEAKISRPRPTFCIENTGRPPRRTGSISARGWTMSGRDRGERPLAGIEPATRRKFRTGTDFFPGIPLDPVGAPVGQRVGPRPRPTRRPESENGAGPDHDDIRTIFGNSTDRRTRAPSPRRTIANEAAPSLHARVRSAPRGAGLASLGAGDWLRSAPGIGFGRRRELASLGAGNWLRSAPGPRAAASRRPGPSETPEWGGTPLFSRRRAVEILEFNRPTAYNRICKSNMHRGPITGPARGRGLPPRGSS